MDKALSGATTPDQSEPGSNGNEGVLCITQSPSITGTSPSDCLVSYLGHSLGDLTPLQRCSRCILQPQPTGQGLLGFSWVYDISTFIGYLMPNPLYTYIYIQDIICKHIL